MQIRNHAAAYVDERWPPIWPPCCNGESARKYVGATDGHRGWTGTATLDRPSGAVDAYPTSAADIAFRADRADGRWKSHFSTDVHKYYRLPDRYPISAIPYFAGATPMNKTHINQTIIAFWILSCSVTSSSLSTSEGVRCLRLDIQPHYFARKNVAAIFLYVTTMDTQGSPWLMDRFLHPARSIADLPNANSATGVIITGINRPCESHLWMGSADSRHYHHTASCLL